MLNKKNLHELVATTRQHINLLEAAIEKDYYVTQVIHALAAHYDLILKLNLHFDILLSIDELQIKTLIEDTLKGINLFDPPSTRCITIEETAIEKWVGLPITPQDATHSGRTLKILLTAKILKIHPYFLRQHMNRSLKLYLLIQPCSYLWFIIFNCT